MSGDSSALLARAVEASRQLLAAAPTPWASSPGPAAGG